MVWVKLKISCRLKEPHHHGYNNKHTAEVVDWSQLKETTVSEIVVFSVLYTSPSTPSRLPPNMDLIIITLQLLL